MSKNEKENYIYPQISKYMTDKKLIETVANLNTASPQNFAKLHANADEVGGKKVYSNITIVAQDFSKGTGDKMVKARFNISPSQVEYLYAQVFNGVKNFDYSLEKIFANKENDATVSKLRVVRSEVDKTGKPRKYAWYIQVENGIGIAEKTSNGGTYCKKGSYQAMNSVYVNLTDEDFFKIMYDTKKFIEVWEMANCVSLIRSGLNLLEQQRQEKED